MIAVIDYSLGNVYSVRRSLDYLGAKSILTGDVEDIMAADKIILPGVGAFRDAIGKLNDLGLTEVLRNRAKSGIPFLGICLGMQLLFDTSHEYGSHSGLGLIPGEICPIEADLTKKLKVPQIGWNSLDIVRECALTKYIKNGDYVYYVHSYYAKFCDPAIVATSEYGVNVPGIVERDNIMGCQFHPEKSGRVGLNILKAFCEI